MSGSGCGSGIFSVQPSSCETALSESGLNVEGLRFRCINKAALDTTRVNQALSAEPPSKLRTWTYAERNACCTASSASSRFRRMEYAIVRNLLRDVTNISSNASFLSTSSRVSTSLAAASLAVLDSAERTFFFGVRDTGKDFLAAASLLCPPELAVRNP